jgi:aspartyl-tRNA(Asn)/glutamyl-tRNA(Gln) amidotransferase subunit A
LKIYARRTQPIQTNRSRNRCRSRGWAPTSRELVEAALAQITDPAGEGARTFVKVYAENARAVAVAQDRLRLKELFDVAGERTLAGSKALDDSPGTASDECN